MIILTAKSSGQYGNKSVGTTAAQLTTSSVRAKMGVWIVNTSDEDPIYIGFNSSVTTSNGYFLEPYGEIFLPISNANKIWVIAKKSNIDVRYLAI